MTIDERVSCAYHRHAMEAKRSPWRHWRRNLVLWLPAMAAGGAGCTPTTTPGVAHGVKRVVPVAIRYRLHAGPRDAMDGRMSVDFAAIRGLGFDTILVDSVDDERRSTVVAAAGDAELACILGHRATDRYIRSGQLPPDIETVEALVRKGLKAIDDPNPLSMHRLVDAPAPSMMQRLREVQTVLGRQDPGRSTFVLLGDTNWIHTNQLEPCTLAMDGGSLGAAVAPNPRSARLASEGEDHADIATADGEHRKLVIIQSAATPDRPHGPSVEEWRLRYHRGLAAGLTDGVLFSAYRGSTRDRRGLRGASGELPLARRAALKALTARAARWSALLTGSQVLPVGGIQFATSAASAALFIKGQRRFLLIYNPHADRFVRDTVHVPRQLAGVRLRRAVDVDTLKRYPIRRARLSLAVHLKPAGAMLLELVPVR